MTTPKRPSAGAPRPYQFPGFERARLKSGLQVVTAPVQKLPLVSIIALIDAGATRDVPGTDGLAVLTAKLLLEGTTRLDGSALTDAFERLGATVDVSAGWDAVAVELTVLRKNAEAAMALLAEVVQAPGFRTRDIARLKGERLAQRMQLRTEPRALADESFERSLYAEKSRFAYPEAGRSASIRSIGEEDIRAFYDGQYAPNRATIVIAGDMETDAAIRMVETSMGGWHGEGAEPPAVDDGAAGDKRRIEVIEKTDAPQSELRIGHRGVPRSDPDHFKLVVMNAALGGLFSSRINLNLREAHGYSYGAHSSFAWRRNAGPFMVSTAVESGVTADATREVLVEIERIREAPIKKDELNLATAYLQGVFPIRYETTSAIANALAALVTYGYPADYFDRYRDRIGAVTTEDVLQTARAHLHPEQVLITAVGDPERIAKPLEQLNMGPVTVVAGDTEAATA